MSSLPGANLRIVILYAEFGKLLCSIQCNGEGVGNGDDAGSSYCSVVQDAAMYVFHRHRECARYNCSRFPKIPLVLHHYARNTK